MYSIEKKLKIESKKAPNSVEKNSFVEFDVVFINTGRSIKIPKLSEIEAIAARKNIAYILTPTKPWKIRI